jgi:hypothetical protein
MVELEKWNVSLKTLSYLVYMEEQEITLIYNSLNRTRKNQKVKEAVPKAKVNKEAEEWKQHLEKGDKLYKYMLENLDSMLNKQNFNKYFDIVGGIYPLHWYSDDICEQHGDEIQNYLIPWIQNEYHEKRLFDKTLWKPFYDIEYFHESYLGYKKMLKYTNYLLQLIIDDRGVPPNFNLALYDCGHEFDHVLRPGLFGPIPEDMMFPVDRWNRKYGGR